MSKLNPGNLDYNKDGKTDAADDVLAREDYNKDGQTDSADAALKVQDANKDGFVSPKEEKAYKQKQGTTTTEYKYDSKGNVVSQSTKSEAEPVPEPTISASQMGYSEEFLKAHPDVNAALELARKYKWTEEQFVRYVESETDFGKTTTDTQALFDVESVGTKSEEWAKKVADRTAVLKQQAVAAGIQLTDEEANTFARNAVRSGLTDQDTLAFLSGKFTMPGLQQPGQPKPASPAGQSAQIVDEIRAMARSYGITVTDQFIQDKVREGMTQGAGWRTWLEGQRGMFRDQAKNLYPTASNLLDKYTLGEILQPYLNDASEITGININQMNLSDPMWTAALNGPNGPMNRDEWIRTLKTNKQYGYDGTIRARTEAANLGDSLLGVLGMA